MGEEEAEEITAWLVLPHASTALTLCSRFARRKTSKGEKGEKRWRWLATGERRPLGMISRKINSREGRRGRVNESPAKVTATFHTH